MPEGLRESERGQNIEEAASQLAQAEEHLQNANNELHAAIDIVKSLGWASMKRNQSRDENGRFISADPDEEFTEYDRELLFKVMKDPDHFVPDHEFQGMLTAKELHRGFIRAHLEALVADGTLVMDDKGRYNLSNVEERAEQRP